MPIDASILSRLETGNNPSYTARALSMAEMFDQRRMRGEQLRAATFANDQREEASARARRFQDAIARKASDDELAGIDAGAYAVHAKNRTAQRKAEYEQHKANAARLGQLANGVKDLATQQAAIAQAVKEGLLPQEAASQLGAYDPSMIEQFRAHAIEAEKYWDLQLRQSANDRAAEKHKAEQSEPVMTLADVMNNPGGVKFKPSQYGGAASLIGNVFPRPIAGANWQKGTQSFSFPNPITRTVSTVETKPGTIAARPRAAGSGRRGGGAQKPKAPTVADLAGKVLQDSAARGGTTLEHAIENLKKHYQNDPQFTPGMRLRVIAELGKMKATSEENPFARPAQQPGQGTPAPGAAAAGDKVLIEKPEADGKWTLGYIPRANLQAALQRGARLAKTN